GWRTFLRARASNMDVTAVDELESWLADGYTAAYRTAWLILRDAADAEEAVQEAYLRAWRFRDAVREADVRPWLYRVLVNACCSKLRGELARRSRLAGSDVLDTLPSPGAGPETAATAKELSIAVADAVAALPEHLRIPVVLRYFS